MYNTVSHEISSIILYQEIPRSQLFPILQKSMISLFASESPPQQSSVCMLVMIINKNIRDIGICLLGWVPWGRLVAHKWKGGSYYN